jgi:hypothetical protein
MAKSGERGGKREGAGRKRVLPEVLPPAPDKGIASRVLAMDGPPNHTRHCHCETCSKPVPKCVCEKSEEGFSLCICAVGRAKSIQEDHAVCRCEVCGWWEHLASRDKRISLEARKYLTDRRDGKPAQGVFVGDTREASNLVLEFGNLVMPADPAKSRTVN